MLKKNSILYDGAFFTCMLFHTHHKIVAGIKIATFPCTTWNHVCATPPTPLDGFCSYSHTVTNMTWRWP